MKKYKKLTQIFLGKVEYYEEFFDSMINKVGIV